MTSKRIAALVCLSFVSAGPAFAQGRDIVVTARSSLRGIELQYTGEERLDHARAMFDQIVPVGSDLTQARRTLAKSGERCKQKSAQSATDCMYYSFEGIDDHLRDVVWTVRLDADTGKVSHVSVDRESIGS